MRTIVFASVLGCAAATSGNGVNYVQVASGLSPIWDYLSLNVFECHQLALDNGQTIGTSSLDVIYPDGTSEKGAFRGETNYRVTSSATYAETENTWRAVPLGCSKRVDQNKIIWGYKGNLVWEQKTNSMYIGLAQPDPVTLESANRTQLEAQYSSFCTE